MFNNALLMGAASAAAGVPGRYVVDYGCRFNDNDAAKLSLTFTGSPTSDRIGTFAFWFKRGHLSDAGTILSQTSPDDGAMDTIYVQLIAADTLHVSMEDGTSQVILRATKAVFRDPGAWYHLVIAIDGTQTNINCMRIYINGKEYSDWDTGSYPNKNLTSSTDLNLGSGTNPWTVGTLARYTTGTHYDGYLSQFAYIDGLQLGPESFGEFNNGVWRPIDITGLTYGNNGWLFDFADSSDLGNDISGNNNDFTSSGLATNDQVSDTPTDNFAVFTPLYRSNATFSDGNTTVVTSASTAGAAMIGFPMFSGKWHIEFTAPGNSVSGNCQVGIANYLLEYETYYTSFAGDFYLYKDGGNKASLGATDVSYGAAWTTNRIAVEFDADSGVLEFFKDGVSQGDAFTGLSDGPYWFVVDDQVGASGVEFDVVVGDDDFTDTPTTGFVGCTSNNLAEATVKDGRKYFDTILYEGNGSGKKVGQFQPIEETFSVADSAMFNSADTDYMKRTMGAGNQQKWTFATWWKPSRIGTDGSAQVIFGSGTGYLSYNEGATGPVLYMYNPQDASDGTLTWKTTREFEDCSQWLHIVWHFDTTQAATNDRSKLYINGVEETAFTRTSTPNQNGENKINKDGLNFAIGADGTPGGFPLSAYLAQTVFLNGVNEAVSSFGEVDSTTNRWIPKDVSGLTYPTTNSFLLTYASKNSLGLDTGNTSSTAATVTFVASTQDDSDQTTYTYSSQSLSTAATGRIIAVCINGFRASGGARTVSSCTIAGETGTKLVRQTSDNGDATEIWAAVVDTGTSGTISVVFSSSMANCNIGVYAIYNARILPADTVSEEGNSISEVLNVPTNGVAIGTATATNGGEDATWGGLTENYDDAAVGGGNSSGASTASTGAITVTFVPATPHVDDTMVAASFGPLDLNSFTTVNMDTTNGSNQFHDTPTRNFLTGDTSQKGSGVTVTNGGLTSTADAAGSEGIRATNLSESTVRLQSGKWYFEYYIDTIDDTQAQPNLLPFIWEEADMTDTTLSGAELGNHMVLSQHSNLEWRIEGTNFAENALFGSRLANGDVVGFAIDADTNRIFVSLNDTWATATGDPDASGAGIGYPFSSYRGTYGMVKHFAGSKATANYGQWEYFDGTTLTETAEAKGYFRFTPPEGYLALNNDNLTETDSFQTAFSWTKNRDATDPHMLFDRVRGRYDYLSSDAADPETTDTNSLQRFLKQGQLIGNADEMNTSMERFVSWDWFIETTGAGSTLETGSIDSECLVDTTSGFSVVKWTGSGANATIGHGLGVVPKFIIVKNLDSAGNNWVAYHESLTNGYHINLDTDGVATEGDRWQDTTPTTTVFSVSGSTDVNKSTDGMLAYCWAEIEGFSAMGEYTGTGNADGPVVFTGMSPSYLLIKKASGTANNWNLIDNKRIPFNDGDAPYLYADTTAAETNPGDSSQDIDLLSTGFKIRNGNNGYNKSGDTYIYVGFASNPFGGESTTPATAV